MFEPRQGFDTIIPGGVVSPGHRCPAKPGLVEQLDVFPFPLFLSQCLVAASKALAQTESSQQPIANTALCN
jgi:hypothetical protein